LFKSTTYFFIKTNFSIENVENLNFINTTINGIKIENVSAMLGHTNIRQTQHYAKVLDVNVMEDMQKLITKYN
jgi:hypothetical protein